MPTNATKNPGTRPEPRTPRAGERTVFSCATASAGIAAANARFLVSLVTAAALNARSSSNNCLYVKPAPMTCAVSCTARPSHNPAASGHSPNKKCAACGTTSMAREPHSTTLATAQATSVCVAAMAGANADTAVTPHMDVPAASRDPSRGVRPAAAATRGMRTRPAPTEAAAAGTQ